MPEPMVSRDVLVADAKEILASGRRAADLTKQLLAFSRKQVLEERNVDLGATVLSLEPMLRRLVPERITFAMTRTVEGLVVRADPGELHRVTLNLVVNAVDAIEGRGAIDVHVDEVVVAADEAEEVPWDFEPGRYARIQVRDTGSGIPEDVLDHIFEPFYTTKGEVHGTGLGLSTVYGVVKQSGGHVFVDSAVGEGTTFRIFLPRVSASPDRADEPPAMPGAANGARILVVEDDAAIRRIIHRVLSRAGYQVLVAEQGEKALAVAGREQGIDLVISDVVMPGMGGVELRKRLAALHPTVRFILVSGYSEEEVYKEIREMDTRFLPKPFTPAQLLRCVSEVLAEPVD